MFEPTKEKILELVADLDEIETDESKSIIAKIDSAGFTESLMDALSDGMKLVHNHKGFEYYMKYEESFNITVMHEVDPDNYSRLIKEYDLKHHPERFDENGEYKQL